MQTQIADSSHTRLRTRYTCIMRCQSSARSTRTRQLIGNFILKTHTNCVFATKYRTHMPPRVTARVRPASTRANSAHNLHTLIVSTTRRWRWQWRRRRFYCCAMNAKSIQRADSIFRARGNRVPRHLISGVRACVDILPHAYVTRNNISLRRGRIWKINLYTIPRLADARAQTL